MIQKVSEKLRFKMLGYPRNIHYSSDKATTRQLYFHNLFLIVSANHSMIRKKNVGSTEQHKEEIKKHV